jgi:ABC-type spermidine/putrescine transport system permease subunit II
MLPGGPMTSMVIIGLFIVTLIVLAIVFFKLFEKAGFNGVMGLLMVVPVVNLGVALYLAFTQWPVLTELAQAKLQLASVGIGGPGQVAQVAPQVTPQVTPVAMPTVDPAQPSGA